ncbi:MAG: DUF523 domain-containing protein [Coriobacteriia bacterium]|nr:DUF523 domain-containing protein [Coriobacteriia bacterium]
MRVAVSACLLGHNCKYNGGNNLNIALVEALQEHEVVPVCPETAGGLPRPRVPAERVGDCVLNAEGEDVTAAFVAGARACLAQACGCDVAVLQPRSPSCGWGTIYDGTFTGTLVPGNGVFAEMLSEAGVSVLTPTDACPFLTAGGKR